MEAIAAKVAKEDNEAAQDREKEAWKRKTQQELLAQTRG